MRKILFLLAVATALTLAGCKEEDEAAEALCDHVREIIDAQPDVQVRSASYTACVEEAAARHAAHPDLFDASAQCVAAADSLQALSNCQVAAAQPKK